MEVYIKANLCEGTHHNSLYFRIKYKLKGQWKYRECTYLTLISQYDSYSSDAMFRKQVVEKLNSFCEGEVEELIIERVKNFFKQQKIDNSNKSEYDRLLGKYGSLKFKIDI